MNPIEETKQGELESVSEWPICTNLILNRTIVADCNHEFWSEWIESWNEKKGTWPIWRRKISEFVNQEIDHKSNKDYLNTISKEMKYRVCYF